MCILPIVSRQRLGTHIPAALNTHTIEELLDASFSMQSMSYQMKVDDQFFPELLVSLKSSPDAVCCAA
jgi:hypothetical protein